ncbi:hypothetical protein GOP47_0016714 [Adiantum capillus-veneris]|uniref:Kinesin-like protein n=1 Tax=Adiantum capillus-veneris TaxID=13818 RepID=A0A9D4UJ00_ADICA|nr:hypothetical protein GOP47_0016714 [Adiantum capillus-veneris]
MQPAFCVQTRGGNRGRSSATGPCHQHNQLVATLSQNGDSNFFDDSAMVRWLQSAGLHHLATPLSAATLDHRMLPELTVQNSHRHIEKSKVVKQSKVVPCDLSDLTSSPSGSIYFNKQPRVDDLLSDELQLDSSPGIFDIHTINTELLSEEAEPGWWDSSSSPYAPFPETSFENGFVVGSCKPSSPSRLQSYTPDTSRPMTADKEKSAKDIVPAKIKVVVRKRPINKKELARSEEDIICIEDNGCFLTVHEPKLKVDLTAYVEKHEFVFDAILDEDVSNDEVYMETVEPIIPTLFQRTKATCFAYGQTGSGKTYTMQPLPLKASEAILSLMHNSSYKSEGFQLWLSFFEIYGGKLFDLLNDRRKLCMREDGRQQVCIVGLKEFQITDLNILKEFIEKGSLARSTGTTGANEESSRSHAILQLAIKKGSEVSEKKRSQQVVGKLSFIDLAGSERGADTTDNDRQTRLEGAEINKSLLALKECIRALDSDQGHIPFRGSKLTEVLRDSFVGDSRTVMISCISPSSGSCEHTLNTLRYADRVKGLSRNCNSKRDFSCLLPGQQEPSGIQCVSPSFDKGEEHLNLDEIDMGRMSRPSTASSQINFNSPSNVERKSGLNDTVGPEISHENTISGTSIAPVVGKSLLGHWYNEKGHVSLHDLCKGARESKNNLSCTAASRGDLREERPLGLPKANILSYGNFSNAENLTPSDRMAALLKEEDNLVSAHCKELENTINFIREEMKLLAEVEQPGSQIDAYVSQLSKVLSKKAAGLVNLQAQLARFQKMLKEQEILGLSAAA